MGLDACFLPSSEANAGAGVGRGREGKDGKISRYLPRLICYNIAVGQRFRVFGEHDMSKDFAEKVLDTIYAKAQEHGGECRISRRQYEIISEYINFQFCDPSEVRSWAYGNLGKYYVELHDEASHGCCCNKISLRDEAEVEAERKSEAEAKAQQDTFRAGFDAGDYVGQPKKRMDFTLTLASEREFDGYYGLTRVYQFADEQGNCIVWFTSNTVGCYDEDGIWQKAEVGDKVTMRATVKEHKEYKGIKQTVINRPAIKSIAA